MNKWNLNQCNVRRNAAAACSVNHWASGSATSSCWSQRTENMRIELNWMPAFLSSICVNVHSFSGSAHVKHNVRCTQYTTQSKFFLYIIWPPMTNSMKWYTKIEYWIRIIFGTEWQHTAKEKICYFYFVAWVLRFFGKQNDANRFSSSENQ